MKLAIVLCLMIVFASVANATFERNSASDSFSLDTTDVPPMIVNLVETLGGKSLEANTCTRQMLNSFFSLVALVNVVWHQASTLEITTRIMALIGTVHSTLVECGFIDVE